MSSELLGGETADPAELIAAAEARLDAARRSGATPPPMTGVVEAPTTKRRRKAKAGAKPKAGADVAASLSGGRTAAPAPKPKAKRKPKPKPKQASSERIETLIPSDAMDGLEREDPPSRLGLWGWVAMVTSIAVLASGALSGYRAPLPSSTAVYDFQGSDGRHPPQMLAQHWLRSFAPGEAILRNEPDRDLLQRFAEHLVDQAAVASVEDVHLIWERDTVGDPLRVLRIRLTMREPVLPVMLPGGDQAWVDAEARLLPGLIRGPESTPVVRGYGEHSAAALDEVLAIWPDLRTSLAAVGESELITTIHLDHAFHRRPGQRGIVFETAAGTLIEWGRPGDERYGVSVERKLAMLRYELRLHGDLRQVAVINLRFSEPSHILVASGS